MNSINLKCSLGKNAIRALLRQAELLLDAVDEALSKLLVAAMHWQNRSGFAASHDQMPPFAGLERASVLGKPAFEFPAGHYRSYNSSVVRNRTVAFRRGVVKKSGAIWPRTQRRPSSRIFAEDARATMCLCDRRSDLRNGAADLTGSADDESASRHGFRLKSYFSDKSRKYPKLVELTVLDVPTRVSSMADLWGRLVPSEQGKAPPFCYGCCDTPIRRSVSNVN